MSLEEKQGEKTEKIPWKREGSRLLIGVEPQLIVDCDTQENFIRTDGRLRAYHREVKISRDLLEGKRANVMQSALRYYYDQACRILEGMNEAEKYRKKRMEK